MKKKSNWPKVLQDMTREILTCLPVSAFVRNRAVYLKYFHETRYGYITLEDLLSSSCIVRFEHGSDTIEFGSIDELVSAGWAVD